ncbi:hypothetical protein LEP1GSC060_2256 [Leptospira weilii serovar Ranarum str. ICFT]|uniref:Uncharacterized protein n=1 Tax=Leptospira weilii serovar Ranarum str. ICFT TaxID=1218598 RepID=N1WAT0_9LEPT|nr:hypothetical protein LEP1GSC060_2256 [Leptospira weilii serovar Ranarum str. ICFT]
MNAFLWVGVQGANALEFLIRPRFQPSNSRYSIKFSTDSRDKKS